LCDRIFYLQEEDHFFGAPKSDNFSWRNKADSTVSQFKIL